MDVGINFALNLINFNAKTSFDGKFDPPQNSIHLAGDQNFYQYSPLLYGNSDGDWREGPCQNCNVIEHGSDEMQDSHNLDHHDSKRFKVCGKCSKDQRTPNEEQQKQLDVIIEQIRSTPNTVPQNYLYDRQLLSANPEDYCKLDIFTFFPNRMVKHMGLPEVKCWNGVNCKVPLTSKRTKKDNVVSEVVEKSYIIRYFEGMDSNGWIVGPKFYCKRCEQFRSVFDDPVNTLLPMGVPAVLLRRCGFVSFKDSIISREVYEYIMTHMTSPCGAENIATHFSKLRSLRYIEDARVCLEMQLLKFQQTKSASTLSGYYLIYVSIINTFCLTI